MALTLLEYIEARGVKPDDGGVVSVCVCVCVCARARARVRVCVRAFVYVGVRVRACVHMSKPNSQIHTRARVLSRVCIRTNTR